MEKNLKERNNLNASAVDEILRPRKQARVNSNSMKFPI